ncbi:MAG: Gfo/Idh/MocA family oxidoreductase [Clostridiales bacterium]|nr:Gfo/Idh/MocA family oxidoreductase [Clostridiales bacterium]
MENSERIIKVGLIGVGAMGKKYAKMLDGNIEGMRLTAIGARSDKTLEWVKANISSEVKIYRSAEDLINGSDIDCVLIAVPHKAHKDIAISAFRAGKDVLCEKPAAADIADAEEMKAEAEKYGRKYGIMFQWRTFYAVKKFKELLESGTVGKIRRINLENTIYYRTAHYHNSADWRSTWKGEGGGALINQGQHILDMWLWLFGMPESIYVNVKYGKYNDFYVEDEATLVMNYGDNVTGTFILTTGEIPYKEELSVVGTKGKITMRGSKLTVETYPDSEEYGRNWGGNSREGARTEISEIECGENEREYCEMLENFRDNILFNEPLKAVGQDGINALQLTVGAYVSSREKREIPLPLSGEYGADYQKAMFMEFEEKEDKK